MRMAKVGEIDIFLCAPLGPIYMMDAPGYDSAWRDFIDFCREQNQRELPRASSNRRDVY